MNINIDLIQESRPDGSKFYTAVVTDGEYMDQPAYFAGNGKTPNEAVGECIVANREALGVTLDFYEETPEGRKLVGRSTVYGQAR